MKESIFFQHLVLAKKDKAATQKLGKNRDLNFRLEGSQEGQ